MVRLQKRIDARSSVVAAKIENVERMIAVADIDPHLAGQRFARHLRIEERHLGGVGVQRLRLTHERRHRVDQRIQHLGDVRHPVAHRRARQVDAVPAENAFEPMQRQMIRVLAGGDVCEQPGPRQPLVDDGDRRVADRHMVVTFLASVLEANMLPDKQTRRLVLPRQA